MFKNRLNSCDNYIHILAMAFPSPPPSTQRVDHPMCIYFCKKRRSIASVRITSFRASICVIPDSNPHYVIFIQTYTQTYTQTYMHSHFGINRRIALNFENASSPPHRETSIFVFEIFPIWEHVCTTKPLSLVI